VLSAIGAARPDVVRAWAVPALEHPLLTLARQALPALARLRSPEDGPVLLRALERHASDRILGPGCFRALAVLGPPWDGEALLALLAEAEVDRPSGASSLWDVAPDVLADRPGGASASTLAWWSAVAQATAPRARETRRGLLPSAVPAATVRAENLGSRGGTSAARARALLAKAGVPGWDADVRADAASPDPEVARIARGALPPSEAEKVEARRRANAFAGTREGGAPLDEAVRVLLLDRSDEGTAALLALFDAIPPGPGMRALLQRLHEELRARGVDLVPVVRAMLLAGDLVRLDRGLTLAQQAPDPAYLPVLEQTLEALRDAPKRFEVRRVAIFVATTSHRRAPLPPEVAARWADHVREWALDPADRSGTGLLAALTDLGPEGDRRLAEGLAGPSRAAFLAVVAKPVGRYVSPAVVEAILAPIGEASDATTRRGALAAAFAVAGSDAAPVLRAFARRLRPDARPDAAFVERIVRHRSASTD
jgi:hypothetical protein